ncbi:MAG: hydroxymethylpyrimidine/phosphomethylpyrimidine kinase [Chitinophagales bacterium]|nr:hydroxymethylpyrimidine/phosphomethylpyrimidine kinase [Chitinophagales bacterium]
MQKQRRYIISLAGFDPSAGAGILADIKTAEQLGVYGLGVCTALTMQTEDRFYKVRWIETEEIIAQLQLLLEKYPVEFMKIGIVESLDELNTILHYLHSHFPHVKIIWDPIINASAGFEFHHNYKTEEFINCCKKVYLVTPNAEEAKAWLKNEDALAATTSLQQFTNVYLKSYPSEDGKITDVLLHGNQRWNFISPELNGFRKHGSGCVLSSAITALLAQGHDLKNSCGQAKAYTFEFLMSTIDLLGEHRLIKLLSAYA